MRMKIITMTIDADTENLVSIYGQQHGLSRSATIRKCLRDYFLFKERKQ